MKNDEATAAELWDEATADIIGRTQKRKPEKTSLDPTVRKREEVPPKSGTTD